MTSDASEDLEFKTVDGNDISVDVTVSWRIDPARAPHLLMKVGDNTEDIEATIYSALGIDWTSVCFNDPFHRGFEYVPQSNGPNYWVPIDELFAT